MKLKSMPFLAGRILLSISALILIPLLRGQTLQLLHSFQGADGSSPQGELIEGKDGILYGTTVLGGVIDAGTVFRITKNGAVTRLVSFNVYGNGAGPRGALVQGIDGQFYGTTPGTAFKMTTNGLLTTLALFDGTNGAFPRAPLIVTADGNLYGTTTEGGAYGLGTVFKIATNAILTRLFSFAGTNGDEPSGGLAQDGNGNLYGTTRGSVVNSANKYGAVFKLTTNGAFSTVVRFNNTNGAGPSGLLQGRDGNFYGITDQGGNLAGNEGYGYGTVFRVTTNGQLTKIFAFDGTNGAYPNRLVQGSDSIFYGTTSYGGLFDWGTVFRITTNGVLTMLVSFDYNNGAYPYGGLVEASDGNFYGTTTGGGDGLGTVFRIAMPIALESRHSGNRIILSWPTNSAGFMLQQTVDLNSPVTWIGSTDSPAVIGSRWTVTNTFSGSAQFYRLRKL